MKKTVTKANLLNEIDLLKSALQETQDQLEQSERKLYQLKREQELCTCLKGEARTKAEDYVWLVHTLKSIGLISSKDLPFKEVIDELADFERKDKAVRLAIELFYGTLRRADALPEEE